MTASRTSADDTEVLEIHRTREALRESERRCRELVENAHDVVYAHDFEGRFTTINRAGEQLMGYSRDEFRGLELANVVAPDSLGLARRMVQETLEGHERARYVLDLIARDGRRLAFEVSTSLLRRDGVPLGVQGIARDITDRRRAEEALRQSEERFRLLVENSSDGVQMLARDGTIFYASRPACRLLGYEIEHVIGRPVFDFVHPDDQGCASSHFADLMASPGVAVPSEYRFRHADGTYRHIECIAVNRLDQQGVNAIVVNFRDVTDRLAAGRALIESEERFRAVFDSAMLAIVRVDLEGRVIDANRAALGLGGYTLDEARGRAVDEFLHPDDAQASHEAFRLLASGRRDSYQAERKFRGKNGRTVWAIVSASLVRDAAGHPSFCIAMFENITERKQAEAELVETNQRLSVWIRELEQRTREISLLSELGDMLQACKTSQEAVAVVAPLSAQLFPGAAGVLRVFESGTELLAPATRWGPAEEADVCSLDDCWAIRRGRPHVVEDGGTGIRCRHLAGRAGAASVCAPLIAHGELLGLLTLVLPSSQRPMEPMRRLASTVAEHVALALANLRLHDTLRSQSIRDPLTGLFNRRYMEESLQREMRRAARGREPVGIIMLDIDRFKDLNDRHGHEAGDALLRSVGAILERSVRAEDIACRYGGEEFTLILPEASIVEATQRAEYIRQAIAHLSVQHQRQHLGRVTVSIGVAMYPDHGPTGDIVLRAADAALYQAKARGRNRTVVSRATGFTEGLDPIEA